ncbi:MAG: hypothetical protein ACRCVW_00235 [Brevinema sp.]
MKTKNTTSHHIPTEKNVRHKIVKIILQFFVWILIIAFVSTIGATFDTQSTPIVIKSKSSQIDLAGNSLFMLERSSLNEQTDTEDNRFQNIDPRMYNRDLDQSTLSNTMLLTARKDFFKEIGLRPSQKVKEYYRAQNGYSAEFNELQYNLQSFFGNLGALNSISMITIADIYAFNELLNFEISTEFISLNKTNFLIGKISSDQLFAYFQKNILQWADNINIMEFTFENRGEARKGKNLIKEKGLDIALEELSINKKITISTNKNIVANRENFNYLTEILKAYTNRSEDAQTISEPIYYNGQYKIAVLNDDLSLSNMDPQKLFQISKSYVSENYKSLSRTFNKEWEETKKIFETKVNDGEAFSSIKRELAGTIHHVTAPFTVFNNTIYSIQGAALSVPILKDSKIFNAIINTPINESTVVIKNNQKEWLFGLKPLSKELKQDNAFQATDAQKGYLFTQQKGIFLMQMFGENLFKKYKIKSYPEELTNLTYN